MFPAIGRWACRNAWPIVIVWALVLAVSAVLAPRLAPRLLAGGFDLNDSESGRSNVVLERELGLSSSDVTAIVRSSRHTVDHPEFRDAVRRAVAAFGAVRGVLKVLTPETTGDPSQVSADRRALYLTLSFGTDLDAAQSALPTLQKAIPALPAGMEILLTGVPAIYVEMNQVSEADLRRAETYALPFALLILLLVFRSPVAAGLPLLLGLCCITTNLAILWAVSYWKTLGIFVLNVTSALGLGVAIDYSLLLVSRFREELAAGQDVDAAVERTLATSGKAIFFSGLAVVVSLTGLRFVRFVAIHSIGIGGMIVVAISVLGALTLLPALLSLVGRRVNWCTLWGRTVEGGRWWGSVARFVMRRPVPVFALVLAVLAVLMSPLRRIELGVPREELLPARAHARRTMELYNRTFPDRRIPQFVVTVEHPGGIRTPENVARLREFVRWVRARDGVRDVLCLTTFLNAKQVAGLRLAMGMGGASEEQVYDTILATPPERLLPRLSGAVRALSSPTMAIVRIDTAHPTNSPAARKLTREIRAYAWPHGITAHVGGECGYFLDFIEALYGDFLRAVGVVLALTYLILVLQFGSVVLPVKAVVMNALSIGACYGALVFVFQDGNFASLLGFTSSGYIHAPLPIVIFAVLFGLSMDYEVFMLSRVKEAYDRGASNAEAVAQGLESTGGIITSASAIMIVVAGSFTFAEILLVKALGFGMAFAILLDATLIRAFLVPSTMRLMGDWNWWAPSFARPFLDRLARCAAH